MRLDRRAILLGLAAAALAPAGGARADLIEERALEVRAYAVPFFRNEAGRVGDLVFRSGVELQSGDRHFGGFSGLRVREGGRRLIAVSDHGYWLDARLIRDPSGAIAGLGDVRMAPLLGPNGELLWRNRRFDAEAIAFDGDVAYVGIETVEEVYAYDFARHNVAGHGRLIRLPEEARLWPNNKGLEALAVLARPSPLAGALIAIAERARPGDDAPTQGFVVTGPRAGAAFDVARTDGFDITDAAILPNGDLLLLERRFRVLSGVAARIRRIPGASVAPGALLDGPVIFEADWQDPIDNMEGLSVHVAAGGEVRIVMISDDNYSLLQRTLLLEFALVGERAA